MSLINLSCKEIVWGEAIPGVLLIQSKEVDEKNPFIAENGVPMLENSFGLVLMNDPFVAFSMQPIEFKGVEYHYKNSPEDLEVLWKFHNELRGQMLDMHHLMECIIAAGYTKEQYNVPGFFICHKIAEFIKDREPVEIFEKL